jgi:carbonic anhydrase
MRSPSFDSSTFSKSPHYDEATVRREFAKAVPLRTVVVYCYDPRAVGVPAAVARRFGEEFPGETLRDGAGRKVASTATLFEVVVAGGRAVDALRSITVAQHLFGIENIVVVHHTFCGATSFTRDGITRAFAAEHGRDIHALYDPESICIGDYVESLHHDVRAVRTSPGTPPHVSVFGFVYDIDSEELHPVVEDLAPDASPDDACCPAPETCAV